MSEKNPLPTWAFTQYLTMIAFLLDADAKLRKIGTLSQEDRELLNDARVLVGMARETAKSAVGEQEDLLDGKTNVRPTT